MTFVDGAAVVAGAAVVDEPVDATPLVAKAVRRALAGREAVARDEVQRLLDAGLQVMLDAGDSAPRVADIVATAGLSNQAFYRHFSSRDELVAAITEAGAARLVGYLRHQMDKVPTGAPVARIRVWIEGVLSQASNPAVAAPTRSVLWNGRQLRRHSGEATPVAAFGALLLEPLHDAGSPDPTRDAAAIVDVVFGRLDHYLWVDLPSADDVDHLVNFCLRAIGA